MSPSPHKYLRHMLDEIDYVASQLPGLGEQLRRLLKAGGFLPL